MQSLHHQQQQLASLLSAARPQKDDSTPSPPATSSASAPSDDGDASRNASRISALKSLHRAILYPPNSLLVSHSALFLSQGFFSLLSDKSYTVRQLAARAYGALCSVACSIQKTANGRQNQIVLGSLVDRFVAWALPLLSNVGGRDGMSEMALEALHEFIGVGDVGVIERFALPILKACKELLEDERTSLTLLHQLLTILTLISIKFSRCFQTHFVDIVDLLLGWAMVPDLLESDRRLIVDSFLQFQKHWVNNLQFSLGLLSKFLGDIDVLLQDGSAGTPQQFRRLLALLSCFSAVLQSTASGLLEVNLLEEITEPLSQMLPHLLGFLSLVGKKFGWSKWTGELWRCLTLLAEILGERFSTFYPLAVDILFQNLKDENVIEPLICGKITSFQIHGVLKTNLQLLSLQKFGLLPSAVEKLLNFDAPISRLRLHPNHLVTGSSAATYVFLLQHGNSRIVEQAMNSVIEELQLLRIMLGQSLGSRDDVHTIKCTIKYSKDELFALIKFHLKVLLSCLNLSKDSSVIENTDAGLLQLQRSEKLISFVTDKLNPFDVPICEHVELQVNLINTLDRLTAVEFSSSCSFKRNISDKGSADVAALGSSIEQISESECTCIILEHLRKYSSLLVRGLHISSPCAVKLGTLEWLRAISERIIVVCENLKTTICIYEAYGYASMVGRLVFSIFDAASDRELNVRAHVASVLELFLRAKLIHPMYLHPMSALVLERLGDPDINIRNAFTRLLSIVLPVTVYVHGLSDDKNTCTPNVVRLGNRRNYHWRQVFALKQLDTQIHSQQLVSILSYISQRWKVPLSSWIQRLIHTCRKSKENVPVHVEATGNAGAIFLNLHLDAEEDILERICLANNLAGIFWAVQEAARYCVAMRLRTNLGGPTQTFAAVERMLLDIAHLLQLDTEQNDGNLSIVGSTGAHLLPMRLLLDFVEALKKNVYNAYEGSFVMAPAPRQSSLFFRANKKVCEEWFSRICEPMMNAGLAMQCYNATVHYCTLRLLELTYQVASVVKDKSRIQIPDNHHNIRNRLAGDLLRILRHMALALCKLHEPESLVGLKEWVSLTFSSLFEENQNSGQRDAYGPFAWITGLVYQAEGRYEKAAAHFTLLLQTEESLNFMGSDGVQFAIARIIESYSAVTDWKSLDSWLLELQTLRAKHAGKGYSGALTTAGNNINAIHALAQFDEGDYQAAWASLDLTPKSSCELTFDPELSLQRSEQMLLQAILYHLEGKEEKVSHEVQKAKSMMEETFSILPLDGIVEAAGHANQLQCIFTFEESCSLMGKRETSKEVQSLLSSYIEPLQFPINRVDQDCNLWLKLLRVHKSVKPNSSATLNLSMNLLRLARKQKNMGLAIRLCNYLTDHALSSPEQSLHGTIMSNLQYESAIILLLENKHEEAISSMWSFVRPYITSSKSTVSDAGDGILKAKACLKIAKWLRQEHWDTIVENAFLRVQADIAGDFSSLNKADSSSLDQTVCSQPSADIMIEEIIGTVTKLSSQLCPTMGKTWISYASWCYNQARKSLSSPHETAVQSCSFSKVLPELLCDGIKLTAEEKSSVEFVLRCLLKKMCDAKFLKYGEDECNILSESAENLYNEKLLEDLLKQTVNLIESVAGEPGSESSNGEPLSVTLSSQLQRLLHINVCQEETDVLSSVADLVDIWWSLRRRRVSLFGQAANGFIQFLSYSSAKSHVQSPAVSNCESIKLKAESYTLRATLYILHIILDYGVELKDTLETALLLVPLLPWQDVTPQLFARLSTHPEQVVRKQLEGLLALLAKQYPWSIVYPTLVDVNANQESSSEELQHILGCLAAVYPRLVQDVQLMINELGNVTVLWEELWLSTLQDLQPDVMRRINLLKEEATRIAKNITLSQNEKKKINAAKYSAMMAPVVVTLERRLASTSRKAETPHEIWFHKTYGEQLKSAVLTFKTPPASVATLGEVWRPFDSIAASLATYQMKSSVSLGEVAPRIALLSSSDVPMPGHEKQITIAESDRSLNSALQGIVTIASFSDQVTILSTKTKPKKLVILGSDGDKYTYLLKGREDLRLDARIMQLLQAINGFLHSSSVGSHLLGIRYYSVTPISGSAGLIQWVENVTSIYSVFKSWQNRIQTAQLSATGTGDAKNAVPPPVPRPSDMFYGKIIPALKEKGIRRVISRRDWPQEVKRKVLLDLMREAPRQLLYQEFWCASEGFRAFNSKLKRYSGSVAAMSMVGHILGLGDRHLDNILVDLYRGDVVHIDYNVCFDKGHRLKIPEIVPFRLTQTMEAALGLTGIEGNFRANCEAVLGILRKNKDIILMLLEVFVWDPLVEWTRGEIHDDAAIVGEERKGMELAVSLSLFASRVQEIRVPLQEHHDLFLTSLPAVESALERFAGVLNQYELVSSLYYRADQQRSNLIIHETAAKSMVVEATNNLEKTRASRETQLREFAQAKAIATEKAHEATTWLEKHEKVLDALRANLISEIYSGIDLQGIEEASSLTLAVQAAKVPLTIVPEPTQVQCYEIDKEVSNLLRDLGHGLSHAVTAIQTYSMVLKRMLPINYITTSPIHGWANVLQLSVNSLSSEVLALVRKEAGELFAKVHGDDLEAVKRSHDELCLTVEKYAAQIVRVEEECAELENSIGSNAESNVRDRLLADLVKYIKMHGSLLKEDSMPSVLFGNFKNEGTKDFQMAGDPHQERDRVKFILNMAAGSMYNEVKHKVLQIFHDTAGEGNANNLLQPDPRSVLCKIEEQVEKCILVATFVDELWELITRDTPPILDSDIDPSRRIPEKNWSSTFKRILLFCKSLVGQMSENVLPDVVKSILLYNSEIMDAFGSISQIRGSIDTALEKLIDAVTERASLAELEQSYFVKVGHITEQQLALEEAATKGRDHLSWEEAEELASQEEACRAQLHQLHHSWNQKDVRTSSLIKIENGVKNALISSEHHFCALTRGEEAMLPHSIGDKSLMSTLVGPFAELESLDKTLSSISETAASYTNKIPKFEDFVSRGYPVSEYVSKDNSLLNDHFFFIWKVSVLDSFLDSCLHDVASSVNHNLGFDHLFDMVKKKTEIQLQQHVGQYLKERFTPVFLAWLDKEYEHLTKLSGPLKNYAPDQVNSERQAVSRVQHMLEEHCNVHETARAARSAASLMKKQVNELRDALYKTGLEIIQMEWMHDGILSPSDSNRVIFHKLLSSTDCLSPIILNLSRSQLLESFRSAVSKLSASVKYLQTCEQTSITAEGQLERAMGWACGGPNSNPSGNSSTKNAGIPPEFHDHLSRRRELLVEAREKASKTMEICVSLLELEASRDRIQIPMDLSFMPGDDGRTWEQVYLNVLTRLEVAYHSFSRAEQECKLAQDKLEAASSDLFSASHELGIASIKAESASGDLRSTVLAMRDCAHESSVALSACISVTKGHTALTSECGSMLEEVLAITEGLHDVHNLGRDAALLHKSLMEDISKANSVLYPLESLLSKDVAAMSEALVKGGDAKVEMSPIHGQAIYQSYCLRLREACQTFKPLVPSIISSVKALHSMLTKLARTAILHAGNLHKALEGVGESQEQGSQQSELSRADFDGDTTEFDNTEREESLSRSDGENAEDLSELEEVSSQDKGWISPPDSICDSSSVSSVSSTDTSFSGSLDSQIDEIGEPPTYSTATTEFNLVSYNGGEFNKSPQIGQLLYPHVEETPAPGISDVQNQLLLVVASQDCKSFTDVAGSEVKQMMKSQELPSSQKAAEIENQDANSPKANVVNRVVRGKNAFAVSLLKRVEMKLDGRDISDKREITIAEQVDFLLRQATSIDNLCNMYEGWTPWI